MSIASLKDELDELAGNANDLRQERNVRIARSLAIVKRRIGSPPGLAVCFSAGFLLGSPAGEDSTEADQRHKEGDKEGDKEGLVSKILIGPLLATTVRMALAFLTEKSGNPTFRGPE